MGAHAGTKVIARDNLTFAYDMDSAFSFKGAPTTNLYADGDFSTQTLHPAVNGPWSFVDGITDPNGNKVIRVDQDGTTSWHGRDITVSIGVTYSASCWCWVSPDSNSTWVSLVGEQGYTPDSDYNLNQKGTWQYLSSTGTAVTTNARILTYQVSNMTQGHCLFGSVQFEQKSFATPFVNGTRSNTENIVDVGGTFTPNASSLTYNADGTFSYSGATANGGTQDRITVGIGSYPTAWTDPFSIEAWFKIPSGADWQDEVTNGSNTGTGIVSRGDYGGAIGLWTSDTQNIRFTVRSVSNLYGHIHNAQFDTWYHMVGTHDGGTTNALKTYVNGVLVGTNSFTNQGDAPDQQNWIVGGNNALGGTNGGFFEGDIPIARVYNKALTAAEVEQNFRISKHRFGY